MKVSINYISVCITFFAFSIFSAHAGGLTPAQVQASARRTIAALIQDIESSQLAIDALYQQNVRVKKVLEEMAPIQEQINIIKTQTQIAALEKQISDIYDQLNSGAVSIWANSIDPSTDTNLNKNINTALNAIFLDDQIVKEKMFRVSVLKREITDRIAQKQWINRIQKLGNAIKTVAPNEILLVSQAMAQVQQILTQLTTSRNTNQQLNLSLIPLEVELIKKNLELKGAINQMPKLQKQLMRYNDEFQKLRFILEFMQNPSKAATVTLDGISNFETSSNETLL